MSVNLIGREHQRQRMETLLQSGQAEFVAVYGRRRVGKTFLIDNFFAESMVFRYTATENGTRQMQLRNFADSLAERTGQAVETPESWSDAFALLRHYLESLPSEGRKVVFIDELPWLDRPRSMFIPAFSYFWNSFVSLRRNIILVVCGSATGWMMSNLINNHGGLHNRLTCTIHLHPFTLAETEAYLQWRGIEWSREMIAECYMTFGGVPYYLRLLDSRLSLAENIDALLFRQGGELRNEFQNLYRSLFRNSDIYMQLIRILNRKRIGLTREEIAEAAGLPQNGKLTQMLQELVDCDFVRRSRPIGSKTKNSLYQLTDFFTLFHFRFVDDSTAVSGPYWVQRIGTPAYNTWAGLSFEMLVLHHQEQLRQALGISGILCETYSWRSKADGETPGAQIDLVIDRADKMVTLCEMKYSAIPYAITRDYRIRLEQKIKAFQTETKARHSVQLAMVTLCGLQQNAHSHIATRSVTINELFQK